ncbi:MAG TPA: RraA family protein [Aestuariivirgaceae bacterium]|nr:RraA family protein [Aestuariivirgaceae bacterium]
MADAPMLRVRSFKRPDPGLIERFRGVPTGFLVDALGRSGALDYRIGPIWNSSSFVGSALTVQTSARDNLAPYAALKWAKPGDVLIVETGDFDRAAVMGDIIIAMARNCGIVAVVTDGLVRDVEGIEAVGLPVYARGLTPNSPFKNGPGAIGFPVTVGGVVIEPGDLVLGDRNGVVVAPRARLEQALGALEAVIAKEADMDRAVQDGLKLPGWLDQALADKGVEFVD